MVDLRNETGGSPCFCGTLATRGVAEASRPHFCTSFFFLLFSASELRGYFWWPCGTFDSDRMTSKSFRSWEVCHLCALVCHLCSSKSPLCATGSVKSGGYQYCPNRASFPATPLRHIRGTAATPKCISQAGGAFGDACGRVPAGCRDTVAITLPRHRCDRSRSFGATRVSQKHGEPSVLPQTCINLSTCPKAPK